MKQEIWAFGFAFGHRGKYYAFQGEARNVLLEIEKTESSLALQKQLTRPSCTASMIPSFGSFTTAAGFFLLLLDAVAKNALFEGLWILKQILVSDLPVVRYYGPDQVACLDKDTTTEAAGNALSRLLATSSLQESRLGIQKHAEANFSWPRRAKAYLAEKPNLLSKG